MGRVCALALVGAAILAGCTSGRSAPGTTTERTVVQTLTRTPSPSFTPSPARTVRPLTPNAAPAAGEVEKRCPYIASTPAENAAVNVADIEGDHVYRTTVLTKSTPVGCRFYFYAGAFEAIADIVPRRFATPLDAHNAMVLTSTQTGTQAQGKANIVPGVDAVLFRTKFFGPDGDRDWACVFAKGAVMVIVHTQRTDQSLSALLLAKALAPKF
jgi:hypothetical protein